MARPDWVRAEGIAGFAGQPLVHRGEVLGVLAVFARRAIGPECMGWLRMIADHAAAAIATARAFEQIEQLRAKLELENEYLREEVTGRGVRRTGRAGPGPRSAWPGRSTWWPRPTRPSSSSGRAARARSWSRASSTAGASGRPGRWSR